MSQEVINTSEATAAKRRVFFQLVDATDGITAKTGITGAGRISKNGGASAVSSANIVEIDSTNMPGRYYLELTAGEVDTQGTVIVRFKTVATAEMIAQATVVAFDPYATPATTAEIAIAVRTEMDANSADLNTLITGQATIVGYIDTEVAAIKAKTDNLPAAPAAVGNIPTTAQISDALLARNAKGGSDGPAASSVAAALAPGFMKMDILGAVLTVRYADGTVAYTRTLTRAQLDAIVTAA